MSHIGMKRISKVSKYINKTYRTLTRIHLGTSYSDMLTEINKFSVEFLKIERDELLQIWMGKLFHNIE